PDGYLYFGTGDGGSAGDPYNNAQADTSLLGKMLRIDVNNPNPPYYNIPPTNPFAGSTTTKPEIIALGLRNPWRWSFDKQTGDMWIADVGQDSLEEVNIVTPGNILNKNYGWRCYEGTHLYKTGGCTVPSNNVFPIFEYPHDNATGGYSITGGYVYRGNEFPSLNGYYICTDYLSANGWLIKSDGSGGWNTTMQTKWPAGISSFGETANGTLYATTLSGTLYKVVAANALPVHLVSFSGRETGNKYEINWHVQNEEAGDIYIIEKRTNQSEPFTGVSELAASTNNVSNNYSLKVALTSGQSYYRLKIVSVTGQVSYSRIISANGINRQMLRAFITGTNLMLKLPPGTTSVELFDAVGKSLIKQETDPTATQTNIPLTTIAKGVITVRALIDNDWQVVRVLY
ncbi:MAG TPA: PQQ-dependent sugar dehydrogenase, partial [Segetibacter sp.]|nr:PQQ-dependent sugar dehydrogenase [Segetibacter sp.]